MRHVFTVEECRRGGLARSKQPSFSAACSKGFWACMETHPFFARKYLKRKIKAQNAAKKPRQ